ncbi:hypothetical protein N7539_007900 [Penicillium diatomitis]|uniref:C3H1-type domain-containing protein n=1 Tax=Penicillium diatomitis TaxID=2819901 RepID=A0A9W9WUN2_9EURO|nr:uncharacterized protein N7539_007900 [Penicillium diatomitis]KAJ5475613.1 hypothetical protein N7539_007900 [Penicillium diatomitis]
MEQSSAQNSMPGLPHAGASSGVASVSDYWPPLDMIFPDSHLQFQSAQPSQAQNPSAQQQQQQAPMGITWDHPVFHQQQQRAPHQQNPINAHTDPNHGIYSTIPPPSWQHNTLPSAARFEDSAPYSSHPQAAQYQQGQMAFDSGPIATPESSVFPSYYQQNFFHPQQISLDGTFSQRPAQSQQPPQRQLSRTPQQTQRQQQQQQHQQLSAPSHPPQSQPPPQPQPQPQQQQQQQQQQQPQLQQGQQQRPQHLEYSNGGHHSTTQYPLSASYSQDMMTNTIDLTNDGYPNTGAASHQTIDPSYLDGLARSSNASHTLPHDFSFNSPADYQTPDGMFNYFQNDFHVQPQVGVPRPKGTSQPGVLASGASGDSHQPGPTSQPAKAQVNKSSQPKKTAKKNQKTRKNGSESETSGESDLEVEPEPSPLPPTRPTDPIEAASYDTTKAVWSPRNLHVPAEKVKASLVAFKDVVKALRDGWKDQVQAMKTAENQGDNDKASQIKQSVSLYRRTMERIISTTFETGHPVIIEKLGEHPMTLSVFYSFLADRFQAADLDGSLTISLLKLLARFVTVDEELLQKTNMAKLLPRFVKKGTSSTKELAQNILDNAAVSTKRKQSNTKPPKEESPAKRDSPSVEIAGVKRSRDNESHAQPATKRMVVTSSSRENGKSSPAPVGPVKRAENGSQNGKPPTTQVAPRPKAPVAAPKPTVFFGALSSASKRLGTTNAERKAAQAAAKSTPPPETKEKPAPPAPKPAFSFGDLMADLNKPKQAVVAKPSEDVPLETEEERQKRLRKEARRKLRVTWKPDESLTEIRLFTHDPDEELGPGDGSLRSMGDVKGEGSVLKLHKDLEELEEDDLGGIREVSLSPYAELSEILIESSEMKSANFIKRGGDEQPVSQEKSEQDQREATTLMVFHPSPADVPSTPKEPPAAADPGESATEVVPFGDIPDNVKIRQERYYEFINPKPAPVSSSMPVPGVPSAPAAVQAGTPGFDISNLLKLINAGTAPQPPAVAAPSQPAAQQSPLSDLERTINMFRQQQTQPTIPQIPQIPQVPLPQVSQVPMTQPQVAPGGVNFQQLMNVMQQFQQGGAFPPNQPAQTQSAMAPGMGAMLSQFTAQNQQAVSSTHYEDPERKRTRDVGQYGDQYDSQWSRGKRTKANDPKPYKVGLVACRFWKEGKCRKGDNCTFRHDP